MKIIYLTQGQETLVDDEDYWWLVQRNWFAQWDPGTKNFYACTGHLSKKMHRLILNAPKDKEVDHKDHNTLNNQRYNLRLCTKNQNQYNQKISCNNTTGYKGVDFHKSKRKYRARIRYNEKLYELGHFDDPFIAAMAYDRAARRLFGEFALTNGTPIF